MSIEDDDWSTRDTVRNIEAADDLTEEEEAESLRDIAICVDPESIGRHRVDSDGWALWYESPDRQ